MSNPTNILEFSTFSCILEWGPKDRLGSHSSSMEEPNVDEKKHAMGFCISTIVVQGIFEGAYRRTLGQVMDFNCFTWIFNLVLAKHLCFGQSHTPIPPYLSLVGPFARSIIAMQGGGGVMLQHDKYFFGNYGIRDAKEHLWVWNRKLVMWGHQDMMAPFHILHNNHNPCSQCSIIPTQGIGDYRNMGPKNCPNNYRRGGA